MVRRALWSFGVALVFAAVAQPVMADIFMFKDDKGVVHFTNIPTGDKRFRMVRKEAGTPPMTAAAGLPQVFMPREESIRMFAPIIENASRAHGVDAALVHAVISAESGYNPGAVSRAGARGLMQLMPETARRFGVQNIMDPSENIQGGVRYLRVLMQLFNGNMELAVAAYNAGENAVIRHGHRIPPYAETVHYVPKVLGFYRKFQSRQG
ncbi:MAG: lytic transglycosylase domain-containing protein [Pseudomonadota bacterium]|nr:lytic transglycosylase domain-containing protein [Pseudomonadota bacterium]